MNLLQRMRQGIRTMIEESSRLNERSRSAAPQFTHTASELGYARAYEDAVRKLKALGDRRVSAIVLDHGRRIRLPSSRETLSDALKWITERVSSDARIHVQMKDVVKGIASRA